MRKYDEEFKREAVRKIYDGQSVASVARELGCAKSLLYNWKRQAVESNSESEREVLALKKRVRRSGNYHYVFTGLMTDPPRFCYLLSPVSLIFRRSDPCAKWLDSTGDARRSEVRTM